MLEAVDDPQITMAAGTPVMVRAIRVKEKPAQLIQLFVDTFRRRGLWVPPGSAQPQPAAFPALTAYDPPRKVSYSVIFQPNADGTTTLLLGEAHLGERRQAQGTPAPVFPGGTSPVVLAQEASTLVSYEVAATDEEVLSFYRQTLSGDGLRESAETKGLFSGRGVEMLISTQDGKAERRTVMVLIRRGAQSADVDGDEE